MDNVEKVMTKYKNIQTSRKSFNIHTHIEVLDLIILAQKANQNVMIEVTMFLITTYFLLAKQSNQGICGRDIWLRVNTKINDLLELLRNKEFSKDTPKEEPNTDGGDIDSFLKSSE